MSAQNREKKSKKISKPDGIYQTGAWLVLSFLTAMVLWYLLSIGPVTGRSFPYVGEIIKLFRRWWNGGFYGRISAAV